jgi:3-methyl-2-oxobutanoate hydroxymethyltransferase
LFGRKYVEMGEAIKGAVRQFNEDINQGVFPEKKHGFTIDESVLKALE